MSLVLDEVLTSLRCDYGVQLGVDVGSSAGDVGKHF